MKAQTISFVTLFFALLWAGTASGQPAPETTEVTPEAHTAPKSILILGDSHSMGHFGKAIHKGLKSQYPEAKVTLVAACGKGESGFLYGGYAHCGVITYKPNGRISRPKGCKKNPCTEADGPECSEQGCRPKKLRHYLRRLKPDLVVLQMGSNSWFKGSLKRGWPKVEKQINKIATLIEKAGSQCLWITPPDSSKRPVDSQDAFAQVYERVLQNRCAVFNSRPSQHPYMDFANAIETAGKRAKRNDGTHYGTLGPHGKTIQEQWVNDILIQVKGMTDGAQ
jgi:hypothetical protein